MTELSQVIVTNYDQSLIECPKNIELSWETIFENKFAIHSVEHFPIRILLPFFNIFKHCLNVKKYRFLPLRNSLFLNRETCRGIIQFETYFKCYFTLVENVFM